MSWTRVLKEACPRCTKQGCSEIHDTLILVSPIAKAVLRCLDCKKLYLVKLL